jgi:Adenylate cyclase regulatory domain
MTIDADRLQRDGLLAGVTSAGERAARVELIRQLEASGVSLAQLHEAVEQDRLALVPVERVFAGDAQYTTAQAAEQAGLDEDFLMKDRLALGLSRPAPDELVIGAEEIEALRGGSRAARCRSRDVTTRTRWRRYGGPSQLRSSRRFSGCSPA